MILQLKKRQKYGFYQFLWADFHLFTFWIVHTWASGGQIFVDPPFFNFWEQLTSGYKTTFSSFWKQKGQELEFISLNY